MVKVGCMGSSNIMGTYENSKKTLNEKGNGDVKTQSRYNFESRVDQVNKIITY